MSHELAVLDSTISTLGADSYLGPWLAQVRAEVAAFVASDIFPDITLAESVNRGNQLIARAKVDAVSIVAQANAHREKVLRELDEIRSTAQKAVAHASAAISRIC